jgi:hypothetical protein
MNTKIIKWLVALSTLAVVAVNGLANALPINNQTTGEISDRFEVFFVPAGYVFSIWGLIYLGLFAYTIYQLLPGQQYNQRLVRIAPWYIISNIANIAWILLWHYEVFPLTLPVMLVLLFTLIVIYLTLSAGRRQSSSGERWLVHLPFSIYLGWISVATIANATVVLEYLNWDGWGITEQAWTAIMLAAGVILAILMAVTKRDPIYPLVIVWAFIGIAVRFPEVSLVFWSAVTGAVIALAASIYAIYNRLSYLRSPAPL